MIRRRAWLVVPLLFALLSLAALAKKVERVPAVELARAAIAAMNKSDWVEAVAQLEGALALARERAPLRIERAVVVHAPHTGLGVFEPAPGAVVKDGLLRLYVEVSSFGHRAVERDAMGERYEVKLDVTGAFFADGEPIGERNLGAHSFITHTKSGVTSFGVEAKLGDKAPPGRYEVELKVRDTTTNKRASRRASFVIGE